MRTASNLLAAQDTDSAPYGPDLLQSGLADISWFFPEGFERIATINNPAWCEFRGREFSYKFFRGKEPLSAAEKWLLAREELRFGRIYAPDIYLGLRLLRLEQGVPEWVSFKPSSFILSKNAPRDIYDLAVVARRGRGWRTLTDWLDDQSDNYDYQRIASQLLAAIGVAHSHINTEIGGSPSISVAAYVDSILNTHRGKATRCIFGLPYSEFAEERLLDLYENYRQSSLNKDYIRGTRIHGAMLTGNIMIKSCSLAPQFCNVVSHAPEARVYAHPYLDIATLIIDLAARGFEELSLYIERCITNTADRTQRLLYEIFKMGEALNLTSTAFSAEDDQLQNYEHYVSDLLKSSFGLKSSGVIILRSKNELTEQLRSWFERLAVGVKGIHIWNRDSERIKNGVTIYFPEYGTVLDSQLLAAELLRSNYPSMEILVVGSAGGKKLTKTWPPLSNLAGKSNIVSADMHNPSNTIIEILNNYRALCANLQPPTVVRTFDSDYQAFGIGDEIY